MDETSEREVGAAGEAGAAPSKPKTALEAIEAALAAGEALEIEPPKGSYNHKGTRWQRSADPLGVIPHDQMKTADHVPRPKSITVFDPVEDREVTVERGEGKAGQIVELDTWHRKLMHLLLAGYSNRECAEKLEVHVNTISIVRRSALFRSELAKLEEKADAMFLDDLTGQRRELLKFAPTARKNVESLAGDAENGIPGAKSEAVRLNANIAVLKLVGVDAPQKQEVDHKHLHVLHTSNVSEAWRRRREKMSAAERFAEDGAAATEAANVVVATATEVEEAAEETLPAIVENTAAARAFG